MLVVARPLPQTPALYQHPLHLAARGSPLALQVKLPHEVPEVRGKRLPVLSASVEKGLPASGFEPSNDPPDSRDGYVKRHGRGVDDFRLLAIIGGVDLQDPIQLQEDLFLNARCQPGKALLIVDQIEAC